MGPRRRGALVEQQAPQRLSTARLLHVDDNGLFVGLLFASSGIESEIVAAADVMNVIAGLALPVATVGHLMAMKLLARDDRQRPADADDLRALCAVATDADWSSARRAVRMITDRGFHRSRDLIAALDALERQRPQR